jgi:hypothetical protein
VENYCTAKQAKDDNTAHAYCMLDNQVSKHTLRICNVYVFSLATMVVRTYLNACLLFSNADALLSVRHRFFSITYMNFRLPSVYVCEISVKRTDRGFSPSNSGFP